MTASKAIAKEISSDVRCSFLRTKVRSLKFFSQLKERMVLIDFGKSLTHHHSASLLAMWQWRASSIRCQVETSSYCWTGLHWSDGQKRTEAFFIFIIIGWAPDSKRFCEALHLARRVRSPRHRSRNKTQYGDILFFSSTQAFCPVRREPCKQTCERKRR